MANIKNNVSSVGKKQDTLSLDFKDISEASHETVDFSKVRGSVRLIDRKIKTPKDVANLVKKFLALRLP